jgi:hypothetical protein
MRLIPSRRPAARQHAEDTVGKIIRRRLVKGKLAGHRLLAIGDNGGTRVPRNADSNLVENALPNLS